MALGENIKRERERMGWTTHRLAEEAGRVLERDLFQSNISRYERNEIRPRLDVLKALATVLRVKPIQLEYGDQHLLTMWDSTHKVPLIPWEDLAGFMEKGTVGVSSFLPTDEHYSAKVFGLKITDDSMIPRFQPGDAIIVDPEVFPTPNDYVVAHYAETNWFRQYKARGIRGGKPAFELVPSNDGYASIRSEDGVTILGTMVEHRTYRQK